MRRSLLTGASVPAMRRGVATSYLGSASSADGVTWTQGDYNGPGGTGLSNVARNAADTRLLASMSSFPYIATSTDGTVWTGITGATGSPFGGGVNPGNVYWSSNINQWIILTSSSYGPFVTKLSADLSTYTTSGNCGPTSVNIGNYAYLGTRHMVTYASGTSNTIAYNTNTDMSGGTWTTATTAQVFRYPRALCSNGTIAVLGFDNGAISSSTNGSTWTSRTSSLPTEVADIAWSPALGLFVAVAYSGYFSTSSNGTSWTAGTRFTTNSFSRVTWDSVLNRFIAAVDGSVEGSIHTSTNGTTWTERTIVPEGPTYWTGIA